MTFKKPNGGHVARLGAGALALTMLSLPAHATEGYFALGYDAVQRAQGGAGVAAPGANAMATAINPAAVATVGNEFSLGLEAFSPIRSTIGNGTYLIPRGKTKSGHDVFPVPNFAFNKRLANGGVLNIAAYGNGGMNTSYPAVAGGLMCPSYSYGTGLYCMGKAGVDLSQLFLSVTYAQQVGNISWGIAPTIVAQAFSARGLEAFSMLSNDPSALSGNGLDYSYGIGLRAGIQAQVSPELSIGLAAQTKTHMSKLKDYAGLFSDGGSFDIPASATLGIAYKLNPQWTVMADLQRIWYSGVSSVSNPFPNGQYLGASGGPGFGWDDVSVVKLGAVYKQNDKMTWRFGYAHSSNPVSSQYVMINTLAPGIMTNHFTFGGSYKMTPRDTLDFAIIYAPKNSVTGPEINTDPTSSGFGKPTGGSITVEMRQLSASVGWTHTF